MALQQRFSNFDSLKKWQILVYKRDDNTITYSLGITDYYYDGLCSGTDISIDDL